MRVAIDTLLDLWDKENLASLKLTMLINAVKDSQVYQVGENDIQRQSECTKEYLVKLKENTAQAHIEYNEKLLAVLKRTRPLEHRGIYGCGTLDAVAAILAEYEIMTPYTKKERSVIALSNVSDKSGDVITESTPITIATVRALKRSLAGASVLVEYKLSEAGVMLVCSNRMEDSRLKWFTMKAMESYDGVRVQAVVNAKGSEALAKIEVLNLVNHYKTTRPRIVVILPGVSEYAAKELCVFDRFAKILSPDASIIENEAARTDFLATAHDAYFGGYSDAVKPYDPAVEGGRMEMGDEDKKNFIERLRKLDAAYSHLAYIDFAYELAMLYKQFNAGAISSQLEKVREKKELTEGKF